MKKIKVLIADDHQLFREGLKALLLNAVDLDIVYEASNGQDVIDFVKDTAIDVALIDIDMPVLNGIETTKWLVNNFPNVKVIILSMHNQKSFVQNVIAIGAKGYLLKNTDFDTLHLAIKKVAKGDLFFDSNITLAAFNKNSFPSSYELSEKEVAILKYIVEGFPNKQIADKLSLSPRTIDTYRATIMKKLNVQNAAELIAYAIKNTIV